MSPKTTAGPSGRVKTVTSGRQSRLPTRSSEALTAPRDLSGTEAKMPLDLKVAERLCLWAQLTPSMTEQWNQPFFYGRRVIHDISRMSVGFETKRAAREESNTRLNHWVPQIRDWESARVALAMHNCVQKKVFCGLPCCPYCARKFRRWLVGESFRIGLDECENGLFATLLLGEIPYGDLRNVSPIEAKVDLEKRIRHALPDASFAMGGVEVSAKQDGKIWVLHAHIAVAGLYTKQELRRIRNPH